LTFEKGTAVLKKYRAKYPELASYIREIVPGERRIEIRQRLEGEDINLHLFAIRVLEDEVRYEVKLSGDAEHKTVKPLEWLSLLHDKLARIVAKILYARETSKPEKQDWDLSGPAACAPRAPNALPCSTLPSQDRDASVSGGYVLHSRAGTTLFCVMFGLVLPVLLKRERLATSLEI